MTDDATVFKHLILTKVQLGSHELGRGAFSRVFAADYDGTQCAAKELHSVLADNTEIRRRLLQECAVHSKLQHPNVVKLLGLYYPSDQSGQAKLPVQILELMDESLTSFLVKPQTISTNMKSSILQDVTKGLYYLHNLTPPMMHRDLSSNNILIKSGIAKICDFIAAKALLPDSSDERYTTAPGTLGFMPPEALNSTDCDYGLPIDVFSFGCVVCHVISQQYPDPMQSSHSQLTEVEKRQKYIDHIKAGPLKELVMQCLANDPANRPVISLICEKLTIISTSKRYNL